MSIRKFSEYLDQKGKLQEKPIVDPIADTTPKMPANPEPAAIQGKNWTAEAAAVKDKPVPYSAPGKDEGQPTYEKGLGNDGPENLVYKPDTEDQAILKSWPKSSLEKFMDETKDMSLPEFTNFIKEKQKTELSGNPIEDINKVASLVSENTYLLEMFIRELKRKDGFKNLVKEVFEHTEAYQELSYLMANESVCKNIARALNEIVAEPARKTEGDVEEKEEAVGKRRTRSIAKGGPLDMGSSDVVTTGTTVRPEHNLVNALMSYKNIAASLNETKQPSQRS